MTCRRAAIRDPRHNSNAPVKRKAHLPESQAPLQTNLPFTHTHKSDIFHPHKPFLHSTKTPLWNPHGKKKPKKTAFIARHRASERRVRQERTPEKRTRRSEAGCCGALSKEGGPKVTCLSTWSRLLKCADACNAACEMEKVGESVDVKRMEFCGRM